MEPNQIQPRLSLARVLWNSGRRDDATREARDALALASRDDERRFVQELIDFFTKAGSK